MKLIKKVRDLLEQKSDILSIGFHTEMITKLEEFELNNTPIESPVEQLFFIEWEFKRLLGELKLKLFPQYNNSDLTGKYRLDFQVSLLSEIIHTNPVIFPFRIEQIAMEITPPLIGIEIDGHIWHEKTKKQVQYHKERERFLISKGWKLIRFTGSEVYKDPSKCVTETINVIKPIRKQYHKKIQDKLVRHIKNKTD